MKRLSLLLSFLCLMKVHSQNISIIPQPVSIETKKGNFILSDQTVILTADSSNSSSIQFLNNYLKSYYGFSLKVVKKATKNYIQFDLKTTAKKSSNKNQYELEVTAKKINIESDSPSGIFYAIQSLIQLLPVSKENLSAKTLIIACCEIEDYPRFSYRGMHLDVSRHFFPVSYIKKYIDYIALHKMNYFHWHLTDDQGWRVEIKALPKLTSVGAWRVEKKGKWMNITTPAINEPKTYGGFYTQEDIKEVVAYAKARFVEVVPEIDVPGHSMAMLAAYPNLSTTPNYPYQVNAGDEFMDWEGMNGHPTARIDNSLDPSNEEVYTALDKVMSELAPLFPFEYIHMGGDENAKNNWEKSANVQALMKREGLKDQLEVQSYFVKRMQKIINSKGKKMMGWNEILQGGLTGDAAVMSWQGVKGGIEAAKQGHKVVMSPNDYNYIDFYQGEVTAEGKVYRGLRMKTTYSFDPVPAGIDPTLILGNQANQWTEQLQNMRNVQYMTWPRGLAVAETNWSPNEKKDWNHFTKKVEKQFEVFDAANVKYAKSIYDAIVTTELNTKGELILKMEGEVENLRFYYTIDDQMPDNYSDEYTQPFVLPEDVTLVRIQSYRDGKPIGKLLNIPMESLRNRAKKVL